MCDWRTVVCIYIYIYMRICIHGLYIYIYIVHVYEHATCTYACVCELKIQMCQIALISMIPLNPFISPGTQQRFTYVEWFKDQVPSVATSEFQLSPPNVECCFWSMFCED